jgi:tellurite resistance protein TerC
VGDDVHVSALVWAVTLVVLIAIFAIDLLIIGRRPHEPLARETAIWVGVYVALAAVFGVGLLAAYGTRYGSEFFAGWVTEYSLSVDNLLIFMIIMARFAVPRVLQQRVLLIGVMLALLMRGVLIAAGAAVVDRFVWVFYLFGAFLIYTAIALLRQGQDGTDEFNENVLIRLGRRILPMSAQYDGARLTTHAEPAGRTRLRSGRRIFTPMFIVVIAIGTTDLIFALDSIPAVFGLTTQPYIVFTANVFALMGLRQLYFLLGGLLDRLAYLSFGLAAVLSFIGIKLILDALHGNDVFFINGGEPVGWVPRIPIWLSLVVIICALALAAVASLAKASRDASRQRAKVLAAGIEAGPSGSTVSVSRSDRIVVRLPENASTGYQWSIVSLGDSLEIESNEMGLPGRGAPGAAGERVLLLRPIKSGRAQVSLQLKREREPEAIDRFELEVNVADG